MNFYGNVTGIIRVAIIENDMTPCPTLTLDFEAYSLFQVMVLNVVCGMTTAILMGYTQPVGDFYPMRHFNLVYTWSNYQNIGRPHFDIASNKRGEDDDGK